MQESFDKWLNKKGCQKFCETNRKYFRGHPRTSLAPGIPQPLHATALILHVLRVFFFIKSVLEVCGVLSHRLYHHYSSRFHILHNLLLKVTSRPYMTLNIAIVHIIGQRFPTFSDSRTTSSTFLGSRTKIDLP